jgi:hypothetical protein
LALRTYGTKALSKAEKLDRGPFVARRSTWKIATGDKRAHVDQMWLLNRRLLRLWRIHSQQSGFDCQYTEQKGLVLQVRHDMMWDVGGDGG